MAHETLKSLIRQYINTNGQEAITGQILQDVLIEMVNEYPELTTYATQTWVGQNYLALTGGTMRNNNGNTNTILPNKIEIMYSDTDLDVDTSLELLPGELRFVESDEEYINLYKNSTQLRFALEEGGFANLYAGSFVKSGGTSSQFLKADGSVDNNTYLTTAILNSYATQTWVGQNYLALTGGTMRNNNGNTNTILPNKIEIMYSDTDLDVDTSLELLPGELRFVESDEEYINLYKNSTQLRFALEEGGFANLYAGSFVKSGGTSSQFLKADGSVDGNSYVPMTSINWGTILFDSASNETYLHTVGETFSMEITEGRWAPFSSDPSVLQVSGGRTSGATITYTVAQTVAAKVLIFLVNLDNPQQIIIDNVEIRPL